MSKTNQLTTTNAALVCFGLFVIAPIGVVLKGWALSTLWGWFIVPTFGIPSLSIPAAIGISLIAAYLAKPVMPEDEKKSPGELALERISRQLFVPPIVVFLGWIVTHWMPA